MRVTALIVLAICFLVGAPGRADAEKVKTNQTTKVFARPGEQAKVLVTVKSGQNMTLLAKDGRWLKVRVNGRTGYVPRSKVDMADDDDIARNTRRRPFVDGRSRHRGFGGDAPDDRVGADATGDNEDEGDSKKGNDDEDDEDEAPKKASKSTKGPALTNKKKGGDDDEDEDDEDETPAKKPEKKAAKPTEKKAPPKKGGDDDEDEDDEDDKSSAKKPAKGGDDEDEEDEDDDSAKKTAAKKPAKGDDEDEDSEKSEKETRPVAHVGKKASVYEKPNEDSNEAFVVRPSDILYPGDEKNGWTHVQTAEGDDGWIETNELVDGGGGASGGGKKQIDVRARLGLMFIQQGMRTQGSTNLNVPDNYNIGTSSVALAIGAGILVPRGKKMLLGGEFTYDYAKTLLGGVFYDADGKGGSPGTNIGVTIHNVNVRGMIGIDLKKKSGMALFGRLGYRYQGFLITDVASMTANPAKLPSEVVKAPTIGAALAIPKLTDKIGMRFALDAIVFGSSIKQTVGLEDGASPTAKAVVVGTALTYQWKSSMNIQAAYDLEYMGVDFGAPLTTSTRGHMGTHVTRTDFFHVVTVGIAKPF